MSFLPATAGDRRVRILAWLSLVLNVVIIGTGGAVRLTGSGLGCPTWPTCTDDSFVPTPEMGIHGLIEFGNRTITGVLIVVALLTVLAVWRLRRSRRDLLVLAVLMAFGVPAQGVIGGITVLTGLNPWVVGLHYVVSSLLVAAGTALVWRVHRGVPAGWAVPGWFRATGAVLAALAVVVVLVGIVTTGSGPHAGDSGAARNGLDPAVLQHVHAWPAYAMFGVTAGMLVFALLRRYPWASLAGLLGVELAQIAVGLWQARTGLPVLLVGIHMVLAALVVAFTTAALLALRTWRTPQP